MKRLCIALLLIARVAFGVTLDNLPDLLSHISAPPTNYAFYPWSPCVMLGAQGVFSNVPPYNGAAFGSGNAAVWPVGPQAFVSSLHINDFRPETGLGGINKWEKIRYLGVDHHISQTYIIANDLVLYTITNTLSQWHQIWQGPYTQDNVTCFAPGLCFTNTGPLVLTNVEFMAVLPGAIGNVVCQNATIAPQSAWAYGTNYVYQNSDSTVFYSPVDWNTFQQQWNIGGFWVTQPMLYGGALTLKFSYQTPAYPDITPYSNFGGRTGDSGGALFIRQRGANTGVWKLVGMCNNAGYCDNANADFAVIDQALGWDPQYWSIVGQPQNATTYAALKTNYVMAGYQYTNCAALGPIVPSTGGNTNPPPPPPPQNIPPTVYISTPTNGSTITNVPVPFTAMAADADGGIAEVRFYGNSTLLSITNNSPYSFSWNPTNGSYTLYAIARDNSLDETTSSNITVTVAVPSPPPPPPPITNYPTVSITLPTNGFTLTNASYVISATASQSNSITLSQVAFYDNGVLIGVDYTAPYTAIWSPTNGTHALTAVARTVQNVENTSSTVTVDVDVRPSVQPPTPPVLLPAGSDFDAMIQRMDLLQENIKELVEYLKRLQNSIHTGPHRITNALLATNLTR